MIVAFPRHRLLPLDDFLYALQPSIPHLTRSALHRCLQQHGISRLLDVEGDKPKRQKFKRYPSHGFVAQIGLKSCFSLPRADLAYDRAGTFSLSFDAGPIDEQM